ncbi:MAG: alpha/beta hydrolase [Tannerellaceae bacterium]|jgi:acetyl esterase/lipase|nr:alpha/beta hydrolase [Tannerellaceae bacterium]
MCKNPTIALAAAAIFAANTATAQDNPILLFPGSAPGETTQLIERADRDGGNTGGQTVLRVMNVSEPTITYYPAPKETASGAAIIICPGGGYNLLAYDLEGDEICEWLNKLGITAVLLKYRVPRREGREKHEAPLQDIQRAIGYVRSHAQAHALNPNRIGVMGFSAGGHLSAAVSNNFAKRSYPHIDAADRVSCRPDFCLLVYPAYLDADTFRIAPELKVTPQTPSTMLVQTADDKSYINSSLAYYHALKEAGVPARMHLYEKGGHGYGLRNTGAAVNEWPDRAADWFREIGITP